MYHAPTIMLDFETTGLSPAQGARITEVAALRIEDGRIVERFVTLVNCGVEIPPFITSLTGITQRMVDSAPCVSEVLPRLLEFIGEAPLAAHNASFDEKFLRAEGELLGLTPRHSHLLCSLKLSRRLLPGLPSYGLGNLAARLGIRYSGQVHRAEADAEVSAQLLLHLVERIRREYGVQDISAELLAQIGCLSAARVPAFLRQALACA